MRKHASAPGRCGSGSAHSERFVTVRDDGDGLRQEESRRARPPEHAHPRGLDRGRLHGSLARGQRHRARSRPARVTRTGALPRARTYCSCGDEEVVGSSGVLCTGRALRGPLRCSPTGETPRSCTPASRARAPSESFGGASSKCHRGERALDWPKSARGARGAPGLSGPRPRRARPDGPRGPEGGSARRRGSEGRTGPNRCRWLEQLNGGAGAATTVDPRESRAWFRGSGKWRGNRSAPR